MEKTWIVIVKDDELGCGIIFQVRNAVSNLMARQAVVDEYKRNNWGDLDARNLDAYRLHQFRGKQNIAQICKVYSTAIKEQPLPDSMPIVEYV